MRPDVAMEVERHHDLEVVERWEARHFLRGRDEVALRHSLDPDGFFVARLDGVVAGVCAVAAYPDGALAWVGGMVVDPTVRRRGVARALLHACLDHASARRTQVIGLDATEEGRPLYASTGFAPVAATRRWMAERTQTPRPSRSVAVYPASVAELAEIGAFDRPRFGANRGPWVANVLQTFPHRAFVAYRRAGGTLAGYVLGQDRFVGPLVADDAETASVLLAATIGAGTPPVLHVREDNPDAAVAARSVGLAPTDVACLRMLRDGPEPGRPATQFGLGAWALG